MIAALLQGTLAAEPQQRTTRTGNPFWTASLRVPAGEDAIFVGLTAFAETAGARLMALRKGSAVAAAGVLEATNWTAKDGTERSGWRLTADEVLTVYAARKKRGANDE